MADYSKTTNFTAKDSLPTGNPSKTILGSEHDTEYSNIQTAIATKANKTGAPATTNNLAMLSATGDLADSLIETDGSGNISSNGSATFSALTLGGTLITSSAAELNYNDIATLGTVQASKTVTADASGHITYGTASTAKYLLFNNGSVNLGIYGNPAGNLGFYDFTNARNVYIYSSSANTVTIAPPITASGGITGNVTGNVNGLKTVVLAIGDWDMDTASTKLVAHGLTLSTIRAVTVLIRNDADTEYTDFNAYATTNASGNSIFIGATNVDLNRANSGYFDSVNFNSTSYNRGWVTITYVP